MGQGKPSQASFADRLANLIATVPDRNGRQYSAREIAEEINSLHGTRFISHTYVANLISGRSENPTLRAVALIAELFGVPVAYFFDDSIADKVDEELQFLVALRGAGVQRVALRMSGLSEQSLDSLAHIVERIRRLEGLEDDP